MLREPRFRCCSSTNSGGRVLHKHARQRCTQWSDFLGPQCTDLLLQSTITSSVTVAYNRVGNGNISPTATSPAVEQIPIRIPKNKSTGNLLATRRDANVSADGKRARASFDAGSAQEINNLKRFGGTIATLQPPPHCAYHSCTGTQDLTTMEAFQPRAYAEFEGVPLLAHPP